MREIYIIIHIRCFLRIRCVFYTCVREDIFIRREKESVFSDLRYQERGGGRDFFADFTHTRTHKDERNTQQYPHSMCLFDTCAREEAFFSDERKRVFPPTVTQVAAGRCVAPPPEHVVIGNSASSTAFYMHMVLGGPGQAEATLILNLIIYILPCQIPIWGRRWRVGQRLVDYGGPTPQKNSRGAAE